jgi:hypothetical protein
MGLFIYTKSDFKSNTSYFKRRIEGFIALCAKHESMARAAEELNDCIMMLDTAIFPKGGNRKNLKKTDKQLSKLITITEYAATNEALRAISIAQVHIKALIETYRLFTALAMSKEAFEDAFDNVFKLAHEMRTCKEREKELESQLAAARESGDDKHKLHDIEFELSITRDRITFLSTPCYVGGGKVKTADITEGYVKESESMDKLVDDMSKILDENLKKN